MYVNKTMIAITFHDPHPSFNTANLFATFKAEVDPKDAILHNLLREIRLTLTEGETFFWRPAKRFV